VKPGICAQWDSKRNFGLMNGVINGTIIIRQWSELEDESGCSMGLG
jgi:hypothetical protein